MSVQVTVIFPIVIFFSFFFSHLSLPILQSIILPCLRYVAFKIIFHLLQGLVSRPSRTNDLNVKPLNTRVEKSTDTIPNETVRKNVEYHSWKKDFRDFHGIEPHPLTTAFAWLINNVTYTLRRSYFHSLSYQELLDMIITQDMKKNREFNFNVKMNTEIKEQFTSFIPFLPPMACLLLNHPFLSSSILLSLYQENNIKNKSEIIIMEVNARDRKIFNRNIFKKVVLASDRILNEKKDNVCVRKNEHKDLISGVCADIQSVIHASAQITECKNNGNYEYDNSKIFVHVFDSHWLEFHYDIMQNNLFKLTLGRIELHTRLVRAIGWGLMSYFRFESENKNKNENENENLKKYHYNGKMKSVGEDAMTIQDIVDLVLQMLTEFQASSPFLKPLNSTNTVKSVTENNVDVIGESVTNEKNMKNMKNTKSAAFEVTTRATQPYVTSEAIFCVSLLASCLTIMSNIGIKDTKLSSLSSSTKRIKNLCAAVGPMMIPFIIRFLTPHIIQHNNGCTLRHEDKVDVEILVDDDPPRLGMNLTRLQGMLHHFYFVFEYLNIFIFKTDVLTAFYSFNI